MNIINICTIYHTVVNACIWPYQKGVAEAEDIMVGVIALLGVCVVIGCIALLPFKIIAIASIIVWVYLKYFKKTLRKIYTIFYSIGK